MPPYSRLQNFMTLVTQANVNYEKHINSSLHAIVANLQSNNPNPQTVQTLVNGLPAAKKTKYRAALAFLNTDFINPPAPAAPVLTAAALRTRVAAGPPQALQVVVATAPARHITTQQQAPATGGQQIPGSAIWDASGSFHGWAEITNLTQLGAGAPTRAGDPLSRNQRTTVTAMLREVENAIDLSLKNLLKTKPGSRSPEAQLFEELFGPCTEATLKTVRDNYRTMAKELFGARGVAAAGIAVLNESDPARGNRDFAATFRKSVFRPVGGQIALILGSGFFQTRMGVGAAFAANDFTIGTLVHEFSHACCDTSDIPLPQFLQGGHELDARGFPPATGTNQCVDGAGDRQLVAWIFQRPWNVAWGAQPPAPTQAQVTRYTNYPLLNADAHGQYSLEVYLPTLRAI